MRRQICSALLACTACGRIGFAPSADAVLDTADAIDLGPACPADPRLLACYDFEGDGVDRAGHGNDATLTATSFVQGIDGNALHTTTASRGDLATPSLGSMRMTVDAWVRADQFAGTDLVFDHDSRWAIGFHDGVMFCNTSGVDTPGATVELGIWTHIACTHDGSRLVPYVNGVSGQPATPGAYLTGTGAAAIAGNAPAQQAFWPFAGDIDRLRIWNDVLSIAELCAAAGGC